MALQVEPGGSLRTCLVICTLAPSMGLLSWFTLEEMGVGVHFFGIGLHELAIKCMLARWCLLFFFDLFLFFFKAEYQQTQINCRRCHTCIVLSITGWN